MDVFTVAFFGHRIIERPSLIEQRLEKLIRELLYSKEYVEFLVGRDGDFDQLVFSAVRRCKNSVRGYNSALIRVMPYETAEYRNNEEDFHNYYDEIEIYGTSADAHSKGAPILRWLTGPAASTTKAVELGRWLSTLWGKKKQLSTLLKTMNL